MACTGQLKGRRRCMTLAALLGTTFAAGSGECFQKDTYYDGDPIPGGFTTIEKTHYGCRFRCLNTPHCMFWSMDEEGICFLRDEFATMKFSKGYTSGPFSGCSFAFPAALPADHGSSPHQLEKPLWPSSDLPNYKCFGRDVKYSGGEMEMKRGTNVLECQARCFETASCNFFSFWVPGAYCILHSEYGEPVTDHSARYYISGPPSCPMYQRIKEACWAPQPRCVHGEWSESGHKHVGCAFGRKPAGWCSLVERQPGPWLACIDLCAEQELQQTNSSANSAGHSAGHNLPFVLVVLLGALVVGVLFALLYVVCQGVRKREGIRGAMSFQPKEPNQETTHELMGHEGSPRIAFRATARRVESQCAQLISSPSLVTQPFVP